MVNGVHIVRFSKISDGTHDHIHSLNGSVYVGTGGQIQFVSKSPFVITFPYASPFADGSNTTITGADNGSEYQSSVLTVRTPSEATPYSYSVTLDPKSAKPVTDDPQVIVDPDQSGLHPALMAFLAGALGGALAAILLKKGN